MLVYTAGMWGKESRLVYEVSKSQFDKMDLSVFGMLFLYIN